MPLPGVLIIQIVPHVLSLCENYVVMQIDSNGKNQKKKIKKKTNIKSNKQIQNNI